MLSESFLSAGIISVSSQVRGGNFSHLIACAAIVCPFPKGAHHGTPLGIVGWTIFVGYTPNNQGLRPKA